MATSYAPPVGNINVISGCGEIRKVQLPASVQRSFPAGCPMWTNGANGVEPSLLSTTAVGAKADTSSGVTYSSTYTTVALANAVFAPLFAGFSAMQRIPQQNAPVGAFSAGGATTLTPDDASCDFISVYSEGVATAPTLAAIASNAVEIGTLVSLDGFTNEASTGFYDAAGCLQKDTKTYLYMNAVTTTATLANAVGRTVERAPVGQQWLKFTFQSSILTPDGI